MKRLITLLIFLSHFYLTQDLSAQALSNIPASFVDIGFGARPVAMGYANVGLADDENATYWNPAGLTQLNGYQIGFSNVDQLGLVQYNYFSAIIPVPYINQTLGLSVVSSGDDALRELSLHLAYAYKIKFASFGIALKYRNASFGNNTLNSDDFVVFDANEISQGFGQQISGSANGFGMDLGVLLKPSKKVQFGIMLRDIFAPMSWSSQTASSDYTSRGDYSEGLPFEMVVGTAFKPTNYLTFTTDFQPSLNSDRTNYARAGVEARLVKVLLLRAGTEQGINDLDDERYTLGSGIDFEIKNMIRIRADYAYVIDPFQNTQRIGLTIGF